MLDKTNLYKIIPLFFKVKNTTSVFLMSLIHIFLTHQLEKDSLKAYESKLEDIYSYFEKAYSHGINDNTLKSLDN